ncbi:class I SAM-dependent methyltransferase [Cryobacterium frigoriphilum]|uniref:Class I SAM-dependent methyltransferase n=1 Tax=Cryobacterium frigoriphilum TaxID=1259150 RepID=A0A4R8ZW86_9MICO|nr:class I SAM-dependent methyltransferase [Cryobacterium frigoriphilum]TFD47872.1 class I SAM-dependent methyltransferase [Cryobacterium frigoriphilum]
MDASEWNERYLKAGAADEARLWSAVPPLLLQQSAASWQPGRALDLATGDGRTAIWLAAAGHAVTAVDFSAEAINQARGHAASAGVEVDWVVADALSWASTQTFDLVTMLYLHLPSPLLRQALADAFARLAPGGQLFVLGHDRGNIAAGAPGPRDPELLYTPELLASALDPACVLRCETVRRDLAVDPEAAMKHNSGAASGEPSVVPEADAPRYALDTVLVARAAA